MQDGAIVHLAEDSTQNSRSRMTIWCCIHTLQVFKGETHDNFVKEIFGIQGASSFCRSQTTTSSEVHWTEPHSRERCKYSFTTFLCLFFQILLRAHAQEKQDAIPFWVFSLLLIHIKLMPLHNCLVQGPGPVIIFFWNTNTIGEITL